MLRFSDKGVEHGGETEQGKLTDFHFHDFRRSYTSYCLAAGIGPKTVQYEVGHLDSRMTMDCYGRAVTDPEVRKWARQHFRFLSDSQPLTQEAQHGMVVDAKHR